MSRSGDPGMGTVSLVDLEHPAFSPEFMVDRDGGLAVIQNAGLTGANNWMQREIVILQSVEV